MGRLQTKTAGCDYNEYDRKLTEKFIHGLDDEGIISKILREVSVLECIDVVSSEWVLFWVQRVERSQGLCLYRTKYTKG